MYMVFLELYRNLIQKRWYYRDIKSKSIKSVSHDWLLEKKILKLLHKYQLIKKIE